MDSECSPSNSASFESPAESSFTSQWRTPVSRLSRYNTSWSLVSFSERKDPFADLKGLFQILFDSGVPGPHLLRMRTEFNRPIGLGGQAHVLAASQTHEESLNLLSQHSDSKVRESARSWTRCVVKRLRSDPSRDLNFQVASALSEVKRLCQRSLRKHPNIVKLSSWGLCLDSLEDSPSKILRLPVLVLEKALCDLSVFLTSSQAQGLEYESLCQIARDIGRGVEAIHDAQIAHGDLKPDNILIFDNRTEGTERRIAKNEYTAKVCDFGSATDASGWINLKHYTGTPNWRPPEYYQSSPPVSLQRCDVFTYGLVVWALFLRDPTSPISNIESNATPCIQDAWGRQQYFDSALESIRQRYPFSFNKFSAYLRAYRFVSSFGSFTSPRSAEETPSNYGPQANRILSVLAAALNDNPIERDPRPWNYLNFHLYPNILQIQIPLQHTTGASQNDVCHVPSSATRLPLGSNSIFWKFYAQTERGTISLRETSMTVWHYLKVWIPALRPGSSKQRAYEQCHAAFSEILGIDTQALHLLDHAEESECFRFSSAQRTDLGHIMSELLKWPEKIRSYCIARIRSRFKRCCWERMYGRTELDPFEQLHSVLFNPNDLGTELHNISWATLDIMAWFVRSDIGRDELLNPTNFPVVVNSLQMWTVSETFGELETMWLLLLLESGFHIGENMLAQAEVEISSYSLFRYYLFRLLDDTLAVRICRHFHRIASLDEIDPTSRYYYCGSYSVYGQDVTEDMEPSSEMSGSNTALHDAVIAANYSAVEYLVGSNFDVTAQDENGKTPIELALELRCADRALATDWYKKTLSSVLESVSFKWQSYEFQEILALLRQHPLNTKVRPTLPLGWQQIATSRSKAYLESSVDSPVTSITFQKPETGLLENRRLALVEMQFQGRGQTYILNPVRFIRKAAEKALQKLVPAKEPHFNDHWYKKEAIRTSFPPSDPFLDERAWYRTTAKILYYIWTSPLLRPRHTFLIFVMLSLAGQFLFDSGHKLQLVFGLLGIGPLVSALLSIAALLGLQPLHYFVKVLMLVLAYAPHFMIGLFALKDANWQLCQQLVLGALVNECLLVFGGAMVILSLFYYEPQPGRVDVNIFLSFASFGPVCSILLFCFYNSVEAPPTYTGEGVLVISRAASMINIIVYLVYIWVELERSPNMVDPDSIQLSDEHTTSGKGQEHSGQQQIRTEGRDISLKKYLVVSVLLLLGLTLLFLLTKNLYRAVKTTSSSFQTVFGFVLAPVAIKVWTWTKIIWPTGAHTHYYELIEDTAGASVHMSLFVAPLLVLMGWAYDVPMTLRFGPLETIPYGLIVLTFTGFQLLDMCFKEWEFLAGLISVLVYTVLTVVYIVYTIYW